MYYIDISTVIGDPCELVCATANTTTVLVVVREPVAQDGTPCKNTDSSTGVCVAGRCTVRLIIFVPQHLLSRLYCHL